MKYKNLRLHHKYAVVVQDLTTQWIYSYPCKTKSAQKTQRSLRTFLFSEETQDLFFFLQFCGILACEELSWNHEKCTPYGSRTNELYDD